MLFGRKQTSIAKENHLRFQEYDPVAPVIVYVTMDELTLAKFRTPSWDQVLERTCVFCFCLLFPINYPFLIESVIGNWANLI